MNDKAKQIEEMAKTILKGELDQNRGGLDITEFPIDLIVKVGVQRVAGAKALYNAGYRKERQGEWMQKSSISGFSLKGYMFCSVCDVMLHTCDDNRYCLDKLNYCPMCGAKMKGE